MRIVLISICLCYGVLASSQSSGVLPSATFAFKMDEGRKLISKIEQRTNLNEDAALLSHELVDFAFFVSKQVGVNKVWNTGVQLRTIDEVLIPRFIQQLVIKETYFGWSCSHRFVWDLTRDADSIYSNRVRYRFAGLVPLEGEKVDLFEWYAKGSIEVLNRLKASELSLEHRYSLLGGMKLSSSFRVEIGPEWRSKYDISESATSNKFWIRLNFYKTF